MTEKADARRLGNGGSHHIFLSLIILFLAIVGVWSLYNWYKAGTVKQNLALMLADFQGSADSVITNGLDKQAVDERISEIRDIITKYDTKE
jgi:hypothetical protein